MYNPRHPKWKKQKNFAGAIEENGLRHDEEDLEVEDGCPLPGCDKKRLCQKKGKKDKVTVF